MIGRGKTFRIKRRNSRVTLIVLLLVSIVLFFGNRGYDEGFQNARSEVEGLGSVVLSYVTLPLRGIENFSDDIKSRFTAHRDNEKLKQEIARLSDVEARANALAIKLSRFEKIFGVDGGSGIPERKIAARVVSEIDGPFARSALLNVGANQGVSEGDAVMTVDGLLGHVIRVGKRSSRILKLEDLNSRIAVMSKQSQSRAIMSGKNTRSPQLSFITGQSNWTNGDTVITSGDDGILPTGLPIGTANVDDNGEVNIELFSRQSFVDWVWVYPYEKIKPPEDDPLEEDANEGNEQSNAAESPSPDIQPVPVQGPNAVPAADDQQ